MGRLEGDFSPRNPAGTPETASPGQNEKGRTG